MGIVQIAAAPAKMLMVGSSTTVMTGGMIFPFIIKMAFSISLVRNTISPILYSTRLFLFQLTHIAFGGGRSDVTAVDGRFRRAIRLISERISLLRQNSPYNPHHDTLHALSMVAL